MLCVDVERVQNEANYLEYMQKRTQIKRQIANLSGKFKQLNRDSCDFFSDGRNGGPTTFLWNNDCVQPHRWGCGHGQYKPWPCDHKRTSGGVRTQIDWAGIDGMTDEPIDHSINEFYLFHGTKPAAARGIATTDFRVDLAGSTAGTLYGKGVYFCEASGKADEYACPDPNDPDPSRRDWRPILLCRVLMGNISYCDIPFPGSGGPSANQFDTAALVKTVTHGEYHSVLGDREKCRGTFREYIVFDNAQVYPEWIIWYKRQM
jgi:hypothetical protein